MYRLSVVIVLILACAAAQADELPPPRKLDNSGQTVPPPLFQPALEDGGRVLSNVRNDVRQVQSAREALKAETEASAPIGDVPKPTKAEEISHLEKATRGSRNQTGSRKEKEANPKSAWEPAPNCRRPRAYPLYLPGASRLMTVGPAGATVWRLRY